jgi:two-component system, OmpR family, sensor kinase
MIRRPRLRSLRNKLALVFFAITASAFAVIYFVVVPQLESNLERRELDQLRVTAKDVRFRARTRVARVPAGRKLNERVRALADDTDSRVTVLGVDKSLKGPQGEGRELRFYPLSDSSTRKEAPVNTSLARRAVQAGRPAAAIAAFEGRDIAQVAYPYKPRRGQPKSVPARSVIVYSRDFDEVEEAVAFVRDRVEVAGVAALALALLGGYLVARALAKRVRRLKVAADEVASGRFIDPLPVDSKDELGQLTRAFNEMQEQLRQVDVARKEFIATASHELRTPIFSLSGFVELLQDEELDEDTRREFLDTMSEQVARLQKLSVDLLDLSRLDAGSLELQTEQVDLSELARGVVNEFTPALAEHGTDLEVTLPDEGPEALCDRERVVQIMRILLDNALRHTPAGTHVTVRADRSNGAAGLTVADSGPGLPEESRAKVFERFYTGDAARGAGLGLAIARELAERMDGRLAVRSEAGGTAFTLELPADGRGA